MSHGRHAPECARAHAARHVPGGPTQSRAPQPTRDRSRLWPARGERSMHPPSCDLSGMTREAQLRWPERTQSTAAPPHAAARARAARRRRIHSRVRQEVPRLWGPMPRAPMPSPTHRAPMPSPTHRAPMPSLTHRAPMPSLTHRAPMPSPIRRAHVAVPYQFEAMTHPTLVGLPTATGAISAPT